MKFNLFKKYVAANLKHEIIEICGIKLKFKNTKLNKELLENYKNIEKELAQKAKTNKINVTFMVHMASMFPAKPFAKFLLNQEKYNVKILITPEYRFGKENAKKYIDECTQQYKKEFGEENIIVAPLEEQDDNIDLKSFTDILFPSVPYDVSHSKYNLSQIVNLGILPALVNYAFYRAKYERYALISQAYYSTFWKIFTETKYNHQEYADYSLVKDKNCALVGYCKMDDYINYENKNKSDRKTIMIAPHHSIDGGYNKALSLSNFAKYSKLFLELPDMYPELEFIFRPHPALFYCLVDIGCWTQEQVDNYIQDMKSKNNVIYDDNGDYFKSFSKSDGIIQDCGSYLVEYFYTEKPQCYMLKQEKDIDDKFVELGKKCLENCYIAYEKEAIIDFIENVIINKNDPKKEARIDFARNIVKMNYPNVSQKMYEHFEEIFSGSGE